MRKIYLAGPLKDCTWEQKTEWRESFKRRFAGLFEFFDPMEFEGIAECTQTPKEMGEKLVKMDVSYISKSDIIVANMWKLSIGTIMELVYASIEQKTIFVICSKQFESLWLLAHATKVFRTIDQVFEELEKI